MADVGKSAPSTRRVIIKGLAAAAFATPALPKLVNAQGLRKVTFTLSWLPEGFFAWAFVTKGKNFWKEQGLDVQISRGNGSLQAAQAIAASQFDFGVSNSSAAILLASQSLKLRSLAMLDYESSMGVGVLDSSSIRHPKDLEGKKIGQTLSSSDAAFFKPFCEANHVDMSGMQLLNMDARVRNQALVQKRVDAITGFASSIFASIQASGTKVRMMLYSDYGVSVYGDIALLTAPQRVEKEPELCQQVTTGVLNGLKFTLLNPQEAEEIFLNAVPETKLMAHGAEFARLGMAVQRFNVIHSADKEGMVLGSVDEEKIAKAADFIMKYQAAADAKRPDVGEIFLNRFVGGVKLSAADLQKIRQSTASISAALENKS